MFKPGEVVENYISKKDGSPVDDERVQPNGVELTVDEIVKPKGGQFIGKDGYQKNRREKKTLDDEQIEEYLERIDADGEGREDVLAGNDVYALSGERCVVKYNEIIEIPNDAVGYVFPRSRLLRTGVHLTTALWDSGYEGRGEGMIHGGNHSVGSGSQSTVFIEQGTPIAQISFIRAQVFQSYDGTHQKEKLEEDNE